MKLAPKLWFFDAFWHVANSFLQPKKFTKFWVPKFGENLSHQQGTLAWSIGTPFFALCCRRKVVMISYPTCRKLDMACFSLMDWILKGKWAQWFQKVGVKERLTMLDLAANCNPTRSLCFLFRDSLFPDGTLHWTWISHVLGVSIPWVHMSQYGCFLRICWEIVWNHNLYLQSDVVAPQSSCLSCQFIASAQ